MFLPTKDGIICDYCGTIFKNKFKYYSTKVIEHSLIDNIRSGSKNIDFNSDMCSSCYDLLLKDVKKNIGPYRKDKIKCDLSKEYRSGTFVYYTMFFDEIIVDKDAVDNVKVNRQVMDLNIINGMEKLIERTKAIKEKVSSQGVWT